MYASVEQVVYHYYDRSFRPLHHVDSEIEAKDGLNDEDRRKTLVVH